MSWLLYKTNRFHFAVGLYSDNGQRKSKRGENISHHYVWKTFYVGSLHINYLIRRISASWTTVVMQMNRWIDQVEGPLVRSESMEEGGGGINKVLYGRGSPLRFKLIPFYIPFFCKKVTPSYTFYTKWYPFHVPIAERLFEISLEGTSTYNRLRVLSYLIPIGVIMVHFSTYARPCVHKMMCATCRQTRVSVT